MPVFRKKNRRRSISVPVDTVEAGKARHVSNRRTPVKVAEGDYLGSEGSADYRLFFVIGRLES